MANRIRDESIIKFMILILIFVVLNFNKDLGLVYSIMIMADFIWWFLDIKYGNKKTDLPFEAHTDNRTRAFIESIIAYVAFIAISAAVYAAFGQAGDGIQSIIRLLSATTPILKGSVLLTILGWGVLIPIVETKFFFGSLVEGLSNEAKVGGTTIPLKGIRSMSTWVLAALVSALFALFHISAKQLDNTSLMVTFIFGLVSMFLILKNGELKQAIYFHVISNTVATLAALGLLFSAVGAA